MRTKADLNGTCQSHTHRTATITVDASHLAGPRGFCVGYYNFISAKVLSLSDIVQTKIAHTAQLGLHDTFHIIHKRPLKLHLPFAVIVTQIEIPERAPDDGATYGTSTRV